MSFYTLKSHQEWTDPDQGGILENANAVASLNVAPSAPGHLIIFPKRVVVRASEMTASELKDLVKLKESGIETIAEIIQEEPDRIRNVYDAWRKNTGLMKQVPGAEEKLNTALLTLNMPFHGGANVFENVGANAGQMISDHYHIQVVPRFPKGMRGGGEAFYQFLN